MAPHLPSEGRQVGPYSEGGALYALGIIHANHGQTILPFLLQSLRGSSNDVVQHGACLGLGLAGLGTNNEEAFDALKGVQQCCFFSRNIAYFTPKIIYSY